MKNLLNVQNLSISFGVEPLYEDVAFGVSAGEKIAVVGPNGCGKSTLFKLLAGELAPDAGEVTLRGETTLGYLAQECDFAPGDTPRGIVARALQPVRDAIEQHARVSDRLSESRGDDSVDELLEHQARLQQRIDKMGGWSWEHRVEEMLDRLGISDFIDEPVRRLSGGQRRRVDLARALLQSPDLLLLDEPTNHLDTTTVEWLEHWLVDQVDTLMFVTHDRYFLERIADRIIEIADDGFFDYPGDYRTFIERKKHREQVRRRTEKRRAKQLEKELEWLSGSVKSQNTRSKKRIDEIERLKAERNPLDDRTVEMQLGEPDEFSDVILNARGLFKSHGNHSLLESAHFDVHPGDKIGIIGPNGCGKSTLLDILAGRERYDAGVVERGKKTEIACLHQNAPLCDPDDTVYEAFSDSDYVWIGDTRYHKQSYLKRFLFDRTLQKSRISSLSGGQKRRFAIARVFAENPNLLLLDEPTNDLDIASLEALETTLAEFEGCVVAVSHDRYFLNRVCDVIVAFEDRRLVRYEGNWDDYRRRRGDPGDIGGESRRQSPAQRREDNASSPPSSGRESTGLTWKQQRRLEELEQRIESAEKRRREIESTLSDPDFYESRADEIESLNRELSRLEDQLDELLEEWSQLEQRRAK